MIEHQTANLLEIRTDFIGHGVNTVGAMAAGVAVAVARAYGTDMVEDYQAACRNGALQPGGVHRWEGDGSRPRLLNLASQDQPGPNARTEWLTSSLNIGMGMLPPGASLAIPWIGAGIGGLSPMQTAQIAHDVADKHPTKKLVVVTAPWDDPHDRSVLYALLAR